MKGNESNGMFDIDIPDFNFEDIGFKVADLDELPAFNFTELDGLELPDLTLEIPDLELEIPAFDFNLGDE